MLDKSTLLAKSSNSETDTGCLPSTVIDGVVGDSNPDKNFCSDPATTNPWLRIHTGDAGKSTLLTSADQPDLAVKVPC